MLTLENLKEMEPDTIFAKGIVLDDSDGVNMSNSGSEMKWVAVRGGIHDWAIYCGLQHDYLGVKMHGDKVFMEEHIKKLVPCDDAAFDMYRY